jgi:hypothetical protein
MSSGVHSKGNAVDREASHICFTAERKLYLPER